MRKQYDATLSGQPWKNLVRDLFRMRQIAIQCIVDRGARGIVRLGFSVTLTNPWTLQYRELKVALDFVRQVNWRGLVAEAKEGIDFPFALGA